VVISGEQVLGVALASIVIIVVPGPGVLFIVGRALAYGRRTAILTALGHNAGSYVVAAAVAFGLGPLVQRSADVFLVVKLAGAAYLAWLGIQAIRHRARLADALNTAADGGDRHAFRKGFVIGITNPKAYILFGAILPQFVNREAGDVTTQMLLLALVPNTIGLVTDNLWALSAGTFRSWFARSPRRLQLVGGAGGLAMIGVAVTVALTNRTD
jgi:threonine/homoserine/homoserine lactone efflux protein